MTPPTPNWMKEDPDNHWDSDDSEYEEQPQTINAEAQAGASQLAPLVTSSSTPSAPVYNPNDPLRYFLENGEIAQDEYDKWKLVKEEPQQREDHHQHHKRKTPDYGPGYNSDNDTDSDGFETTADGSILVYGTGYSKQFNDCNYRDKRIFDPWNPTPDATDDRRYTKIATDHTFMLSRLTCLEQYQNNSGAPGTNTDTKRTLTSSFELKIIWERFMSAEASSSTPNLQSFWQENALIVYEAIQDIRAYHMRRQADNIRNHPEYHTTPIETLETTFETIGRMCRCISDDFNTHSVLDYVDEFIVMLYREIEFNALVEAH